MTIDPRRLHQARRHAKKRCPKMYYEEFYAKGQVDEETLQWQLTRHKDVTVKCGDPYCICRNPRRRAKGEDKLTRQELKARERENDQRDD